MKRIYIFTDSQGVATPYQTLTDLCAAHDISLYTVRNALQSSNIYIRHKKGSILWTVNDTYLRESEARKRPGNSVNWTRKKTT